MELLVTANQGIDYRGSKGGDIYEQLFATEQPVCYPQNLNLKIVQEFAIRTWGDAPPPTGTIRDTTVTLLVAMQCDPGLPRSHLIPDFNSGHTQDAT